MVLMRYKNWDYRELRERINDASRYAALPTLKAAVPSMMLQTAPSTANPGDASRIITRGQGGPTGAGRRQDSPVAQGGW